MSQEPSACCRSSLASNPIDNPIDLCMKDNSYRRHKSIFIFCDSFTYQHFDGPIFVPINEKNTVFVRLHENEGYDPKGNFRLDSMPYAGFKDCLFSSVGPFSTQDYPNRIRNV